MTELRNNPRKAAQTDVAVKFQSSPTARSLEGKVYPFHSLDISVNGMRLEVDMPVPIGALLELEVKLNTSPTLYRHLGNVVWADEVEDEITSEKIHDVGIRFCSINNSQHNSWERAVASL